MDDQNVPNAASRKEKAEGDRQAGGDLAGANQQGGGITNRPASEEAASQQAVPERGESKPGAHAGHGDRDADEGRSER